MMKSKDKRNRANNNDNNKNNNKTSHVNKNNNNKSKKNKNNNWKKNSNNKTNNNNNNNNSTVRISKALSWVLRHGALDIGLPITPDGYVPVQEILACNHPKIKFVTSLEMIQQVVESNDKQRFKLEHRPSCTYNYNDKTTTTGSQKETKSQGENNNNSNNNATNHANDSENAATTDDTILCVRANQGHSIKMIDPNLLLTKLSSQDLLMNYPCIVHGTYHDPWKSIQNQGLRRMNRTHIHFASGLLPPPEEEATTEGEKAADQACRENDSNKNGTVTTTLTNNNSDPNKDTKNNDNNNANNNHKVISGMRRTCTIYIYLNVAKCANDMADNGKNNLNFYLSDNGVILTAGINNEGTLPPEYFSHVTDSSGTVLLDQR